MIKLSNISVNLRGESGEAKNVLKDITLDIARGSWFVVTGPNGSGKTTLLKTLAGILPLSSGKITYDNRDGRAPLFSILLQEPDNQFIASTVRNELLLSSSMRNGTEAFNAGSDIRRQERHVRGALERFSLAGFEDRNPHLLSGGEKQRLAMACAWLSEPDVLLLDEPLSFQDESSRLECLSFVHELNAGGVTVVWASPGGDELLEAADIGYLEGGELKFSGARDDFLAFLREHECLCRIPRMFAVGRRLVELLESGSRAIEEPGNVHKDVFPASAEGEEKASSGIPEMEKTLIEFSDVSFKYSSGHKVIKEAKFKILAGECLGLTGPTGSGKTTVLELACGVLKPSSGSVRRLLGQSNGRPGGFLQDDFYLFQSPERMFFTDTVFAEMAFGLRNRGIRGDDLFSHASHALAAVGLDLDLLIEHSPMRLSFGEMRRLALAIAVSLRPRLLLLDEPTSCLDEEGEEALRSAIALWKHDKATVFVASHDVDFLAEVCDRIVFIDNGRVGDAVSTFKRTLSPGEDWPGGTKPYALELHDALEACGTSIGRPTLTVDLFIRGILADAEAHVF